VTLRALALEQRKYEPALPRPDFDLIGNTEYRHLPIPDELADMQVLGVINGPGVRGKDCLYSMVKFITHIRSPALTGQSVSGLSYVAFAYAKWAEQVHLRESGVFYFHTHLWQNGMQYLSDHHQKKVLRALLKNGCEFDRNL